LSMYSCLYPLLIYLKRKVNNSFGCVISPVGKVTVVPLICK
jgi:hypothetical protein